MNNQSLSAILSIYAPVTQKVNRMKSYAKEIEQAFRDVVRAYLDGEGLRYDDEILSIKSEPEGKGVWTYLDLKYPERAKFEKEDERPTLIGKVREYLRDSEITNMYTAGELKLVFYVEDSVCQLRQLENAHKKAVADCTLRIFNEGFSAVALGAREFLKSHLDPKEARPVFDDVLRRLRQFDTIIRNDLP